MSADPVPRIPGLEAPYTTAFGERVVYLDRNRTFCRGGGCGDTFPLLPKANRYINNSMTHIRILELDTMSS